MNRLEVEKDGSLVVHTAFGDLKESTPRIYQEIRGKRVSMEGKFKLIDETSYTFEVKSSNPQYALVIDPTLLYSTFLGGSVGYGCGPLMFSPGERARGVAGGGSGNVDFTGYTPCWGFPQTAGAFYTNSWVVS